MATRPPAKMRCLQLYDIIPYIRPRVNINSKCLLNFFGNVSLGGLAKQNAKLGKCSEIGRLPFSYRTSLLKTCLEDVRGYLEIKRLENKEIEKFIV